MAADIVFTVHRGSTDVLKTTCLQACTSSSWSALLRPSAWRLQATTLRSMSARWDYLLVIERFTSPVHIPGCSGYIPYMQQRIRSEDAVTLVCAWSCEWCIMSCAHVRLAAEDAVNHMLRRWHLGR